MITAPSTPVAIYLNRIIQFLLKPKVGNLFYIKHFGTSHSKWCVTTTITTTTCLTTSFRTTRVSRYQKGKTSLDLNQARDDGVRDGSGISWTICKQSAPHSRQITTTTPHHLMFTGRVLFLMPNQQCQRTEGLSDAWLIPEERHL